MSAANNDGNTILNLEQGLEWLPTNESRQHHYETRTLLLRHEMHAVHYPAKESQAGSIHAATAAQSGLHARSVLSGMHVQKNLLLCTRMSGPATSRISSSTLQ
jgi:hypothetical protein